MLVEFLSYSPQRALGAATSELLALVVDGAPLQVPISFS